MAPFILGLISQPALAEESVHPMLTDKYYLELGVFFPRIDFDASVDGGAGVDNPEFDFEDEFGLSETDSIGAAEFIWRYGDLWSLRAQYFEGSRAATVTLERDIEWDDSTFRAGSNVSSETGLEILRLFTGRNFSKSQDRDYGLGFGIHRIDLGAGLAGEIYVDDEYLGSGVRKVGTTAPLPNIGAWYYHSPHPRWSYGGRVDWLQVDLGEYAGGLTNVAIGANYQVFRNVGVGLKYQLFALNLDLNRDDWNGKAKIQYEGLYLHLSADWN